jgi:hypothetical protein
VREWHFAIDMLDFEYFTPLEEETVAEP